jgi:hypothetical protein
MDVHIVPLSRRARASPLPGGAEAATPAAARPLSPSASSSSWRRRIWCPTREWDQWCPSMSRGGHGRSSAASNFFPFSIPSRLTSLSLSNHCSSCLAGHQLQLAQRHTGVKRRTYEEWTMPEVRFYCGGPGWLPWEDLASFDECLGSMTYIFVVLSIWFCVLPCVLAKEGRVKGTWSRHWLWSYGVGTGLGFGIGTNCNYFIYLAQ